MDQDKVIYDYYRLDDSGYDYEPIALFKNGEVESTGDSIHDPYLVNILEDIINTAKKHPKEKIIVNEHRITSQNVDTIAHEGVREKFIDFLKIIS